MRVKILKKRNFDSFNVVGVFYLRINMHMLLTFAKLSEIYYQTIKFHAMKFVRKVNQRKSCGGNKFEKEAKFR